MDPFHWKFSWSLRVLLLFTALLAASAIVVGIQPATPGRADTSEQSTVIEVTSTADVQANDGRCTFREAITSANTGRASGEAGGECRAGKGRDVITFALEGRPDFWVGGHGGYTIAPLSQLPILEGPLTVDGYSQRGARPNEARSPEALDGLLLIELDGHRSGSAANGLVMSGVGVEVRGLVINSFGFDGIAIDGERHVVAGNYVGTDPTGTVDEGNGQRGIASGAGWSNSILVGGVRPADRNLISGNAVGAASPDANHHRWTFEGNFIGVDRTGMVALPNAVPGGSGALSIDNGDGHQVGGTAEGAGNVISGNASHALAPFNTDHIRVEGNYIGVAADGVTRLPNGGAGVTLGGSSLDARIVGNFFGDNRLGVVLFYDGSTGESRPNKLCRALLPWSLCEWDST